MEDWKECTIGEITNVQTGPFGSQLHEKDYVKEGTPIVTVEHLGNRKFKTQNLPLVSDSDKKRLSKYILTKGDLVFSRVGSVDRCTYTAEENDGWMFSGRCLRVRPYENIDALFLYYYFNLDSTKQFIRNIAVGATMPSINTALMCEVPVKLPPLPTQQKIAQILSSLDDKIELNNKINANLEQQAQALFKEFYKKSIKNVNFTDVVEILGGGTPKTDISEYWNGDIPFFTPKDVENPYCLSTEKKLTEEGLNNCNSRLYPKNTIFVTARGTVGKVCLAGIPMAMNQSCYALKSKGMNQFLAYFYTLETINSLKHKANGATFDAIVTRDFETENIKLLSEEDSKKIENIVEPIFNAILTNQSENKKLSTLRDTLLPKLMSGDLKVD